jgi:phosphate transport system protein
LADPAVLAILEPIMARTTPTTRHTDREYEEELRKLRESLLRMAGRVEQMIDRSLTALLGRDEELARATIEHDQQVNRAEVDTDELCLVILARRQPMGSDLRFITLALKMVTDLERIGDLAVNICERTSDLAADRGAVIHDAIPEMGRLVRAMIADAIDAFVHADAGKAEAVIARDSAVDALYHQAFRDLLQQMAASPERLHAGIHIQSVAKWLERIGDHATNLAELVVFMVRGKDIRHLGKRDDAS